MSDNNDSVPVPADERRKAGFLGLPSLGIGERFASAGLGTLPIVLLLVSFAFYLPFLNILPFAYIRTDLTLGWFGLGRRAVPDRRST